MKSITNIQFVNYKAFYQDSPDNNIEIPFGKNVLIYGENGSGKSSIYEGLKQFFNSVNSTVDEIPARHIQVPKTRTEIIDASTDPVTTTELQNEVAVKITFTDDDTSFEQKIYGVPNENVKGTRYISNANLLNSFLSYRELLKTYLMDNLRDREEFRKKFAFLLFEVILAKATNSATQKTYFQSWEDLFLPKVWYKEENLEKFITGANYDVDKINLILSEILHYFDPALNVKLVITDAEIEYHHSEREGRFGKYPIVGVDLDVKLFGVDVENDEENHLTVLNEARLSSLAISIYLATLVNTPQQNFEYKILFLDDIFIGLDMSNRKPLLEILTKFKKPIIETIQDAETGKIIEQISVIDGDTQYEPIPFFTDYQIFISTYDRNWFEIARQYFEIQQKNKWHIIELYINDLTFPFNIPFIYPFQSKIKKAEEYLHKHDYRACATYLRSMCEEELQRILPKSMQQITAVNQQGNQETKPATLNDLIINFEKFCTNQSIFFEPFQQLKINKNHILNTLSHNDISSPIYKKELFETLQSIKNLSIIEVIELPNKIQDFGMKLFKPNGEKITVRFRKRDTILIYKVNGIMQLSNTCNCDLESSECNGVVVNHNSSHTSIPQLYQFICTHYNLQQNISLFESIHKRDRNNNPNPTTLNQLINQQ